MKKTNKIQRILKKEFTKKEIEALKELAKERMEYIEERRYMEKENKRLSKSKKKRICDFLFIKSGRCNSRYWKGKKCNKKKCPWKNHGSYAMAVADQGNRLRRKNDI